MKISLKEIEATLKYGRFVQGWRFSVMYVTIGISCMIPVLSIIMYILLKTGNLLWDKDMAWGIIYGNAFSILLGSISTYYLCHHRKVKKQVEDWLCDAVPVRAKVTRMDILDGRYKPYQVKVEFTYNGRKNAYFSEPGNFFTGYRKIFLRYVEKDCKILYSIKFEQVMFITDHQQ